jgi:hypothetical protein
MRTKQTNSGKRLSLMLCTVLGCCLVATSGRAQSTPSVPEDIKVYVTVIDPKTVSDVFGRRIAERFVALQVTIRNRNADHQFLIHDVSLDLERVFPASYFAQKEAEECQLWARACQEQNATRKDKTPCECRPYSHDLSSLELSLMRGVAEKGQGQDPRNKLLRLLTGAGTVLGGLVGVAGFGPSYSDSVAVFNGPVLSAYRNAFPDYTINQMNRLSDSAYQSNTLVPRQQAKVLVAFIPEPIFLDKKQMKAFWNDPTSLLNNADPAQRIDFRRTEVRVRGSFIVELENLPPSIVSAQIDDDERMKFEQDKPKVKGYLSGRFSTDARLSLLNQEPEGLSIKLDGTPSSNRLNFIIESTKPVPPDTLLTFEVANDQAVQTNSYRLRYVPDLPTVTDIDTTEGETNTSGLAIEITGTNFTPGKTRVLISGKGVKVVADSIEVVGATKLKAKLDIAKDAPAVARQITVVNPAGESQDSVTFTVKQAPQ